MVTDSILDERLHVLHFEKMLEAPHDLKQDLSQIRASNCDTKTLTINSVNLLIDSLLKGSKVSERKKWEAVIPMIKETIKDLIATEEGPCSGINRTLVDIKKDLDEIKNNMTNNPVRAMSYSQAVSKKPKEQVYFVKSTGEQPIDETGSKIAELFARDTGFQVRDMAKSKDSIKVVSSQTDFLERLTSITKDSNVIIEKEKKRDPLIKVIVKKECEEGVEQMKERNRLGDDDKMEVLFKKEFKSDRGVDLVRIVLRISP